MIALDTNILIHALVHSQKEHPRAKNWILKNRLPLSTTPVNVAEVFRLLTHPKVFAKPLSLASAIDLFESFVKDWEVAILEESQNWWIELRELTKTLPGLSGNEVFDARIALCLKHNGVSKICTLDDDFLKYHFLKVERI